MEREIKNTIYTGISIFKIIKNSIVKIDKQIVSLEDKKYLSLYLGVINCDIKKCDIDYEPINKYVYDEIYNEYFKDILVNLDLSSIDNYYNSLLNTDIVKSFNKDYGIIPEVKSNKKLIKQ